MLNSALKLQRRLLLPAALVALGSPVLKAEEFYIHYNADSIYYPGDAVQIGPHIIQDSKKAAVKVVKYEVTSGTLPSTLTLDPATGRITGTAGSFGKVEFEITATAEDKSTASAPVYFLVLHRV